MHSNLGMHKCVCVLHILVDKAPREACVSVDQTVGKQDQKKNKRIPRDTLLAWPKPDETGAPLQLVLTTHASAAAAGMLIGFFARHGHIELNPPRHAPPIPTHAINTLHTHTHTLVRLGVRTLRLDFGRSQRRLAEIIGLVVVDAAARLVAVSRCVRHLKNVPACRGVCAKRARAPTMAV